MNPLSVGRYRLAERIAQGGMGEVYVAAQTGLGDFEKPVALKLLLPHLADDPHAVELFLTEAKLAARMSHPNVVHIFDVGVHEQYYFIAMELVRGVSLAQLTRAAEGHQQPLSAGVISYIGRELLAGLHHAHEQRDSSGRPLGLVHRDVTPQNVLLSVEGEVKLSDFGIAKARDSASHTAPGLVRGKTAYVSPEQIRGAGVDRRADLFGTALTLYAAATGRSPFDRPTDRESLLAVLEASATPLSMLRPDLPGPLLDAIAIGMCTDPAGRHQSAQEFAHALPESPPLARAELQALIRNRCSESLAKLERQTELAVARPTQTATATQARRFTPRVLVGVAAISAAVLAAAAFLSYRSPTAPIAAAPEAPAPASPVVPPPEPEAAAVPEDAPVAPDESAPKTPERKPAPHGPGFLTVDATPWANVTANGKAIGTTPIGRFPIESGLVTVRLDCPKTGKSAERKVRVAAHKETQLNVDLR